MRQGKAEGFTLIELLVVIAIIVILAAVLFPVFLQAQRKAKIQGCLFNLKQLGLGMFMYADDNKGKFAYGSNFDCGYDRMYPGYVKDPRLLYCPAEKAPNMSGYDYSYRDGVKRDPPIRISYTYRNRFYPFDPRNSDGSYANPWQPNSPGISQVGLMWDNFTLAHMYGIGVLFGDGRVKLIEHDQLKRSGPQNGWLCLTYFDTFPDSSPYKYRVVHWSDPPDWHEMAGYTPNVQQ